ncbi:transcriptional regulator [Candidatus Parcubacteria bacterium]|nr:MAG: transcriptional regulator [Candidatus Parcubacteria bacterium]
MVDNYEEAANNFLELSSHQRLQIIFRLLEKKSKVTSMAKDLNATTQEVHRNFARLEDGGFITKNIDGYYSLTTYGNTICSQIPSIIFLSHNRKYFEDHNFGDIPPKFIMRIGQLANSQHIKGITKILEQWKSIYKNADEYIYEMLTEIPLDIIEPKVRRVEKGVKLNYILSEGAVIPKGRKNLLLKLNFAKLIDKGLVERKMKKTVLTLLVLNEKEATVSFPNIEGEPDITEMFYSTDLMFHEWCLDYFRYCWYASEIFQESKLRE